MEADPVVGEQGVGSVGFGIILVDRHVDVFGAQSIDQSIEFPAGKVHRVLTGVSILLVAIVDGGFLILPEGRRPDHQEQIGRLVQVGGVHGEIRNGGSEEGWCNGRGLPSGPRIPWGRE